MIAVKLGILHYVLWASREYLERNGAPHTPKELLNHRLLDHRGYHVDEGDWSAWFGLAGAANLIIYVTDSSSSLLSAIQNGLGIGMLPTYVCEWVEGIVPLSLDLRTQSVIWLTYHPDIQRTARMRAVIDWIKDRFNPELQPLFRDEFHPPTVSVTDARPLAAVG